MVIQPEEAARRVRAARAYAGMTRAQLAERGPLTDKQLKRLEDGKRLSTTREELLLLGEACGVPPEFMEVGFLGAQEMFQKMTRIMAVVLAQDLPAILAEAERYHVQLDVVEIERGTGRTVMAAEVKPPRAGSRGASGQRRGARSG